MNGWNPPETAPKDGKPFLITTAGPNVDLCCWVEERGAFVDYYFKRAIAPVWPYMVGWKPVGPLAEVGNTEDQSREANGFPPSM